MAASKAKRSLSSILSDRHITRRFAPSGSIFEKNGKSRSASYGSERFGKVTDTGGFASLGRDLDLAGGVWRALGASSTDEWGVRTVSYRFL